SLHIYLQSIFDAFEDIKSDQKRGCEEYNTQKWLNTQPQSDKHRKQADQKSAVAFANGAVITPLAGNSLCDYPGHFARQAEQYKNNDYNFHALCMEHERKEEGGIAYDIRQLVEKFSE